MLGHLHVCLVTYVNAQSYPAFLGWGGRSGLFPTGEKHSVFGKNTSESFIPATLAEKWSFQSLPCACKLFIYNQVHMICVSFI